ncbi:hypothetical protein [Trichlorobacter ammonificans]|uniref:Uncharacterized protein n=1 Tax=Trichlorobacter ammonificans TaxID=2916410 RepID=A0ABN8HHW1_9BACT|nr:hypothetical protein [Trichlorobacter ammonificans]CAH2030862.1 conserved protein of unknown function [Trichlorobacter ammonificans]
MSRQHCAVCAWRETCAKRFSVTDSGARCPDFSRDVTIKTADDEASSPNATTTSKEPAKQ